MSASSHGTYDGHNIVKLKANGKELTVEDVPAINYKGRRLVPIGMLRQTGLDVVWNGEEHSVDVIVNNKGSNLSIKEVVESSQHFNVSIVNVLSDSEFTQLTFYYDEDIFNSNSFDEDFEGLLRVFAQTEFEGFNLVDINDLKISTQDFFIRDYLEGRLTPDDFFNQLYINDVKAGVTQSTPQDYDKHYYEDMNFEEPYTDTSVIESKINGDFEGFDYENLYELDNGQIWKQTSVDYSYTYKYRPDVTIHKDGFQWKMYVEGMDDPIFVEQLK